MTKTPYSHQPIDHHHIYIYIHKFRSYFIINICLTYAVYFHLSAFVWILLPINLIARQFSLQLVEVYVTFSATSHGRCIKYVSRHHLEVLHLITTFARSEPTPFSWLLISPIVPKAVRLICTDHIQPCAATVYRVQSLRKWQLCQQYPPCNSWTELSVVRLWAFSEEHIEENTSVTRCHRQSPTRYSWDWHNDTKSMGTSVGDDHTLKRPGLYVCRWVQIQPLYYTGGHVLVRRCVGGSGLLHRRNRWHSRSAHMVCSRHNGSVGGAWHAQQTMLHHYLALTSTPWSIWNQMELFTRGMYHPPIVGDQPGKALLNTWDALNLKRMKVCMQSMCGRLGSWWWQGETIPDINLRNSNSKSIAIVSVITSLVLTLVCEIN